MKDRPRFYSKTALITGAGSEKGIGFAAAGILAKAGGDIAITSTTDRIYDRVSTLESSGVKVKGYVADLMNRDQVVSLVDKVIQDFGRIDILINNAGMVQVGREESFVHMAQLAPSDWDESIDRNLGTCYNATRFVLPHMIENKYGRIVSVASVTGPLVSNPGETAYSAAKAAIVQLPTVICVQLLPFTCSCHRTGQ